MPNLTIKNPLKKTTKTAAGVKLVRSTGSAVKKTAQYKAVKKTAQYKAAKKAAKSVAKRTSAPPKTAAFLAVGATTAGGAYLLKKRGGDDAEPAQQMDLTDPAVAAGV